MTKPTKWHVHLAKTQISLGAQADQSLHCLHEESMDPQLLIECTAKTLIRMGDAQADLSLRWVNMPFCWFSHALAQKSD